MFSAFMMQDMDSLYIVYFCWLYIFTLSFFCIELSSMNSFQNIFLFVFHRRKRYMALGLYETVSK